MQISESPVGYETLLNSMIDNGVFLYEGREKKLNFSGIQSSDRCNVSRIFETFFSKGRRQQGDEFVFLRAASDVPAPVEKGTSGSFKVFPGTMIVRFSDAGVFLYWCPERLADANEHDHYEQAHLASRWLDAQQAALVAERGRGRAYSAGAAVAVAVAE